jgi:hypothetical protein
MNRFSEQQSRDKVGAVVLAAVDDSPVAPGVARCAADIALASKGTVVVFTAVPVLPRMHTTFDMGRIDERRVDEEDGAATVARVLPILDSLGVPYRIGTRPGVARWGRRVSPRDIARSIRRAARDAGADLFVVGSRCTPWTTGSGVAARLTRRSRADVIVVPLQVPLPGRVTSAPRTRATSLEPKRLVPPPRPGVPRAPTTAPHPGGLLAAVPAVHNQPVRFDRPVAADASTRSPS